MGDAAGVRRTLAGLFVLAAAVFVLSVSGQGQLALPEPGQSWSAWLQARDAVTVVFAATRMLALAVAWYLLAVATVAVAAAGAQSANLVAVARWMAVPLVRTALQSVLGVSLATAGLTATPGAPPPNPVATAEIVASPPGVLPTEHARAATPAPPPPGAPVLRPTPQTRANHADGQSRTWRVRSGDHFWSIAQQHLARALDTEPDDATIARYWRRLVEHNRDRLADRDNPDLLYPGQILDLPPR